MQKGIGLSRRRRRRRSIYVVVPHSIRETSSSQLV